MINTLKLSVLSAAFLTIAAVSGLAQTGHVVVKVPFEFTVGNATLPAGDYSFQGDEMGVVTISSLNSFKSVMLLTNPESTNDVAEPRLKFDKVNGVYQLTEIDITGEPARRIVKVETSTKRTALVASRTAAATNKSLK